MCSFRRRLGQLVTCLLLVILWEARFHNTVVNMNNLIIAGDLAYFTIITHAATLLTTRRYLRKHRKMAIFRFAVVNATYILWVVIIAQIWHATDQKNFIASAVSHNISLAVYLMEGWFFTMILYDLTVLLFVSTKTLEVRMAISSPGRLCEDHQRHIRKYVENNNVLRGAISSRRERCSVKQILTWLFSCFCDRFVSTKSRSARKIMRVLIELVFPFILFSSMLPIIFLSGLAMVFFHWHFDYNAGNIEVSWGLGQLLAAFMVILPFLSLIGAVAGKLLCPSILTISTCILTSYF